MSEHPHTDSREPLLRIAKRDALPLWKNWAIRLAAVVLALLVCAVVVYATVKLSPLKVYAAMWSGAFGTVRRSWVTVRDSMLLLCVGIGLAPAFKMRFWNIGGKGQFIVGAIVAAVVAFKAGAVLPGAVTLLLMCLAAMAAAGAYGAIAAALKVRFGTNETLLTLMLNYIALYALIFLGETKAEWNFLLNPESVRPTFGSFASLASFPGISIGKFNLNVCVILTFVIGVLVFIYLKYTKHGYEIAVVGDSVGTARYAGIKVNRVVLRTVFLSACLIGLAAAFKVGTAGILSTAITDDVGWTGVIVAWLAKLNTVGIFLVSALIGVLDYGSTVAASSFSAVDSSFANMLQGVILFTVLTADFLIRFRVVIARKGEPAHE